MENVVHATKVHKADILPVCIDRSIPHSRLEATVHCAWHERPLSPSSGRPKMETFRIRQRPARSRASRHRCGTTGTASAPPSAIIVSRALIGVFGAACGPAQIPGDPGGSPSVQPPTPASRRTLPSGRQAMSPVGTRTGALCGAAAGNAPVTRSWGPDPGGTLRAVP